MKKYLMFFLLVMFIAAPVSAANRTIIRRQRELNTPKKGKYPKPDCQGQGCPDSVKPPDSQIPPDNGDNGGTTGGLRHGFLVAPVAKITQVNDQFGCMMGGRVGWILNESYIIGLGGCAMVHQVEANELSSGDTPDMTMKYGGLVLEYVIRPQDLVHFSVYTLIGLGLAEFDYTNVDGDDNFLVVEPAVNAYLRVTEYFKVGLGVGYRLASGVDLEGLEDGDLSGPLATLTLAFEIF